MDLTKNFSIEIKNQKLYLGLRRESLLLLPELMSEVAKLQDEKKIDHFILFPHDDFSFKTGMSSELMNLEMMDSLQNVFTFIKNLSIQTTVMVSGSCLGLFAELIFAFKNIYILENCQIAFDHIKWGIVPFIGGSLALIEKIGIDKALEILLTGRSISGDEAIMMGLIQKKVYRHSLYEEAILNQSPKEGSWINTLMRAPTFIKDQLTRSEFISKNFIFNKTRDLVIKKLKNHRDISIKYLNFIEEYLGNISEFHSFEKKLAFDSYSSEEGLNLFTIMATKQNIEFSFLPNFPSGERLFRRVAIAGLGIMGANIAWPLAMRGYRPLVKDKNQLGLEAGLYRMGQHFRYLKDKKSYDEEAVNSWQRSIVPVLDYRGFNRADLIIESVSEDFETKIKVLREIEDHTRDNGLICTNSSSLSINLLSNHLKRPQNFAGLHFANPVYKVPLVEVISHDKVSRETLKKLCQFVVSIDKIPIVVKDCPALLVGRLLIPYFNEAIYLLEEGHSVEEVDAAALHFGMQMGPLRMMDELGMDFILTVAKTFFQAFGIRSLLSVMSDSLVANKMLGRKSGKGLYLYSGGKVLGPSPLIKEIFPKRKIGKIDQKTVEMRLIIPIINEATRLISEGSVENPRDIDLAAVLALGFPDYRGGPLRFCQYEGVKRIVGVLEQFEQTVNAERFRPSKFLLQISKEGKGFFDGY